MNRELLLWRSSAAIVGVTVITLVPCKVCCGR